MTSPSDATVTGLGQRFSSGSANAASTLAHSSASTMPRTGSCPATVRTSGSGSMSQPTRPAAHAIENATSQPSRRTGAPSRRPRHQPISASAGVAAPM